MEETDNPLSIFGCDEREYMTVDKFNTSGEYYIWRNELLASLATKNKLPFLEEGFKPELKSPDFPHWQTCDRLVKTWLLTCLSQDVKDSLKDHMFAYEIWNHLESTYGIDTLKRKESGQHFISAYLERFKRKPTRDISLNQKLPEFDRMVGATWKELNILDRLIGCYIPVDTNHQRAIIFYDAVCTNNEYPQLKKRILNDTNMTYGKAFKLLQSYMKNAKHMTEEHHPSSSPISLDDDSTQTHENKHQQTDHFQRSNNTSNNEGIGMLDMGRVQLLKTYIDQYRHVDSSSTEALDTSNNEGIGMLDMGRVQLLKQERGEVWNSTARGMPREYRHVDSSSTGALDTSNNEVIGMLDMGRVQLLKQERGEVWNSTARGTPREYRHVDSSSTGALDTRRNQLESSLNSNKKLAIGLLGLNDIGKKLAVKCAHSHKVSQVSVCCDKDLNFYQAEQGGISISTFDNCSDFVNSLTKRRVIIIATDGDSSCVEMLIDSVVVQLDEHDLIIDASLSWFDYTKLRKQMLGYRRIGYLGMGVTECCNGEGFSFVIGGDYEYYCLVEPMLREIAVTKHDGPCVAYAGKGGMGHYVHMVHNGVKYGQLHLVAECYSILKYIVKLDDTELFNFFRKLKGVEQVMDKENNGASLLKHYFGDPKFIKAAMWTVHESVDSSVAVPTISMSLNRGILCTLATEPHKLLDSDVNVDKFIGYVEEALIASILSTYIQGIKIIEAREKSVVNILRDILKVWKVHSLIDPKYLDDLYLAYDKYHRYKLEDFISDPSQFKEKGDNEAKEMSKRMMEMHSAWKNVIIEAIKCDISVAALSAGLHSFEEFYRKVS